MRRRVSSFCGPHAHSANLQDADSLISGWECELRSSWFQQTNEIQQTSCLQSGTFLHSGCCELIGTVREAQGGFLCDYTVKNIRLLDTVKWAARRDEVLRCNVNRAKRLGRQEVEDSGPASVKSQVLIYWNRLTKLRWHAERGSWCKTRMASIFNLTICERDVNLVGIRAFLKSTQAKFLAYVSHIGIRSA